MSCSKGVAVPTRVLVEKYNNFVRTDIVGLCEAREVSGLRSYAQVWARRWRAMFGGRHMRLRLEEPVGLDERRSKAAPKQCLLHTTVHGSEPQNVPKFGAALWPRICGRPALGCLFSKGSRTVSRKVGPHCGRVFSAAKESPWRCSAFDVSDSAIQTFHRHCLLQPEANVFWQWSQYLVRDTEARGKRPLLVNLDETSIPVIFTQQAGTVMVVNGPDAWRSLPRQRATKADTRMHFTLVAVFCNSPTFQTLMPHWVRLQSTGNISTPSRATYQATCF